MTSKIYSMLSVGLQTLNEDFSYQFVMNYGSLSASKLGLMIYVTPCIFMVNLNARTINVDNFAAISPHSCPRL